MVRFKNYHEVTNEKNYKEIDKMTNMLTNFIIQHSDAKREDADIIAFGVKYGLITLAEILGMVVISFLMRELIPGAVILIAFISIRVYAGGENFTKMCRNVHHFVYIDNSWLQNVILADNC